MDRSVFCSLLLSVSCLLVLNTSAIDALPQVEDQSNIQIEARIINSEGLNPSTMMIDEDLKEVEVFDLGGGLIKNKGGKSSTTGTFSPENGTEETSSIASCSQASEPEGLNALLMQT